MFPQDTLDEVWLPHVGAQGWVLLTKDKLIRHHKIEREALITAGVRAFFLSSGKLSGEDQAARFVKALMSMKALVASAPAPFMAIVGAKRASLIDDRTKKSRKRSR